MKGFLLNDLFSIRRLLKSIAIVYLVFMVAWSAVGKPQMPALMLGIMSISYMGNLFSYDEFYHWEKYQRVIPLSVRQVVLARYLSFGIAALVTLVLGLMYLLVMRVPLYEIGVILMGTAAMQMYTISVTVPIYYKLGVAKSRLIQLLAMLIPAGIFMGMITVLRKEFSEFTVGVELILGGVFLVLASKFMAVYEDPRIAQ
ncbi:MAG: ABC-2 transporter permease, partial [Negativibacillus sp.]|nr:ABC-2 transporter permease [Negativibacillus sp.]